MLFSYDLYFSACASRGIAAIECLFSSARKYSFNEMSEWFMPRYAREVGGG